METFFMLLALCEENPPFTGDSPHKGQWRRYFCFVLFCFCLFVLFFCFGFLVVVFFFFFWGGGGGGRLNKRLSKQSICWWFETSFRSLWRHCNVSIYLNKRQSDNTIDLCQCMVFHGPKCVAQGESGYSTHKMRQQLRSRWWSGVTPQFDQLLLVSFATYLRISSKSVFINVAHRKVAYHYIDVNMTTMASQITSLTVVYSTVYSDADQRKHQSSASLAFVWGIPRTKGQLLGKCFHLMTSSCRV